MPLEDTRDRSRPDRRLLRLARAVSERTLRYRLTLEVEAEGRPHVGSGVIQVTYDKAVRGLGSSSEIYIDVKGEAVAVDLGSRGVLFALLKEGTWSRSGPEWIVPNAFGVTKGGIGPDQFGRLAALTGSVTLNEGQLPLLVRFRDVSDPKTVERVDAFNLAASFGPGVHLARATLELTRDPVTTGIAGKLPWLEG